MISSLLMEVGVKIVSTFEARTLQEANGASDRKRAVLLLCVSLCCLLIAACTSAPARPVLGAFTGDERELAYPSGRASRPRHCGTRNRFTWPSASIGTSNGDSNPCSSSCIDRIATRRQGK